MLANRVQKTRGGGIANNGTHHSVERKSNFPQKESQETPFCRYGEYQIRH